VGSVSVRARLAAILFGTAALGYLVDRLTKLWAEGRLQDRGPVVVIPKVLELRYVENSGGAFSLFGRQPWLFFAASLVVAAVILALSTRLHSLASAIGLGLILGGALGNLTDRIVRGPGVSGRVVDWIEFPRVWPVFNVADSCIVVGAIILLLWSAFHREGKPVTEPEADLGRSPGAGVPGT
jgi:signal peptidase II